MGCPWLDGRGGLVGLALLACRPSGTEESLDKGLVSLGPHETSGPPRRLTLEYALPIFAARAEDDQHHAKLAAAGDRLLVVWDHGDQPDARAGGRVFDWQGTPLHGPQVIADDFASVLSRPAATSFDDGFLVVTNSVFDVWLRRLDETATPVAPAERLNTVRGMGRARGYPDLAALGEGIGAVWEHDDPSGSVYTLAALDERLQRSRAVTWTAAAGGGPPGLASGADGSAWVVTMDGDPRADGRLVLARYGAGLDLEVGPVDVPLGEHRGAGRPAIAVRDEAVAVAFHSAAGASVAILDGEGRPRADAFLAPAGARPVVAWGEDALWVAWHDGDVDAVKVCGFDPATLEPVSDPWLLDPTSDRPDLVVEEDQVVVSYSVRSPRPGGARDVWLAGLRWCADC